MQRRCSAALIAVYATTNPVICSVKTAYGFDSRRLNLLGQLVTRGLFSRPVIEDKPIASGPAMQMTPCPKRTRFLNFVSSRTMTFHRSACSHGQRSQV